MSTKSESSSELYKWLKTQESEGQVESSGGFTLDRDKAWAKLGAFQLPFEQAWILKIVQAAMAHPEATLRIYQSRQETVFLISNTPHWTKDVVDEAIFEVEKKSTRDLSHLAMGIRALAQLKKRPFSLQYGVSEHVAWAGEKFVPLAVESKEVDANGFRLGVANFEFGESTSMFSLDNVDAANFRAEVAAVLATHCYLTRQDIVVDRLLVSGYLNDPKFGFTEGSRPLILLKAPTHEGLPDLEFSDSDDWEEAKLGPLTVSVEEEDRKLMELSGPCSVAGIVSVFVTKKRLRKNVVYYDASRGHSEALWVCDGVIVARESLRYSGSVGVGLLISAEGLETDLTGLALRESPEKRERLKLGMRLFRDILLEFHDALGDEGVDILQNHMKSYAIGAVGLVCMYFVPMVGLALVSKAGYDHSSAKRRCSYLDTAFDRGIDDLVDFFDDRADS